jgi:peptidoglycan hydrolase-like protein with peptidoglycan-binding domain
VPQVDRSLCRLVALALVVLAAAMTVFATSAHAAHRPGKAATKQVQRALGIKADGIYGPRTRRAVKRFQRRNGLKADGIVGPATLRALGLAGKPKNAALESVKTGEDVAALMAKIAQCESGGNPAAISPGGTYRGKYQFTQSTWESLGGTGDPAEAEEGVQDVLAAKLYDLRGLAPWPACAKQVTASEA